MTTPPNYQVIECKTAKEMFEYLHLSHERWGGAKGKADWIFRGHGDAAWELIARIHRDDIHLKYEQLFDAASAQFGKTFRELKMDAGTVGLPGGQHEGAFRALNAIRSVERTLVSRFSQLASELRLVAEQSDGWRKPHERHTEVPTEILGIAQHHGVPTSLLDWSKWPKVAAWFACDSNDAGKPLALWALRAETALSPNACTFLPALMRFECPPVRSDFLHAQGGLFTWMNEDRIRNHLVQFGKFPSVCDALDADGWETRPDGTRTLRGFEGLDGPVLVKIVLPPDQVFGLREILWREGVSRPHLMPTLDNVGRAVMERSLGSSGAEHGHRAIKQMST